MITLALILLAILLIAGITLTCVGLANGSMFAWLSVCGGGLSSMVEGLVAVLNHLND